MHLSGREKKKVKPAMRGFDVERIQKSKPHPQMSALQLFGLFSYSGNYERLVVGILWLIVSWHRIGTTESGKRLRNLGNGYLARKRKSRQIRLLFAKLLWREVVDAVFVQNVANSEASSDSQAIGDNAGITRIENSSSPC
ncbi:uncharacterized protein RAG0_11026 [Rhynchosporium agropyri]|uniref:Uncharacterized protein n=1 Tax=Rhynchosporium agropyri TaxID=914238 RepID=A0A1E1L2B3_9HELO|nr:uncharacterized protein RAG0_11026 [Rhynchosporium agropyri]